jgi:hypothetical protein
LVIGESFCGGESNDMHDGKLITVLSAPNYCDQVCYIMKERMHDELI